MRKPRMMPIAITVVISAAALFGGWMLYKQVAVASPLTDAVVNVPGVAKADKPVIEQDKVSVSVELSDEASLKDVYTSVTEQGKALAGKRKLDIVIQDEEDALLNAIWQEAMFDIAQAMETKTYSDIPKTMERVASGHDGVETVTDMDGTNVYVTIKNAEGAKYIVLPRTPNQMGVWPNA
ncbi:hypothetical protein D3P07_07650 [Paenibacillus sp. 1011MAR3C5]|uniref:hypothetical protein n=1 Tax=Paenibacillus sp. 1011MAR3C5 TaxID=1675787 RepID=UPI000E6C5387|nr:hypothetical protein [Paenibacillus sp. 1011MAR3C5]RJE90084.1 hypothetical protein D3P07_07650 [Paenibacillus sp. 1011MAR3C5]